MFYYKRTVENHKCRMKLETVHLKLKFQLFHEQLVYETCC